MRCIYAIACKIMRCIFFQSSTLLFLMYRGNRHQSHIYIHSDPELSVLPYIPKYMFSRLILPGLDPHAAQLNSCAGSRTYKYLFRAVSNWQYLVQKKQSLTQRANRVVS